MAGARFLPAKKRCPPKPDTAAYPASTSSGAAGRPPRDTSPG
jgi:hypothetical protein